MEFDWSTFALEIFNFLVLVWILKRFFYKPVRDAIDRRRAGIEKTLKDATAQRAAAEKMKAQYEARLTDWEAEKAQARGKLLAEIGEERRAQLEALRKTLAEERVKSAAQDEKRRAEMAREAEEAALRQASAFAGKLLRRAADPALDARLADIFATDLASLPPAKAAGLQRICNAHPDIRVASAFPLDAERRKAIEAAFQALCPASRCAFATDAGIIAGIRAAVGDYVIQASVGDELQFFADAAREGA